MKHKEIENNDYLFEFRDENITKCDHVFNSVIKESLSRIVNYAKEKNNDFAIITAYRKTNTKEVNVKNNRSLRAELNNMKLGAHALVGHWKECQDNNISYDKCPADKLIHVVERSYFVFRNSAISKENFKTIIMDLGKKFDQDGVMLRIDSDLKLINLKGEGGEISFGGDLSVGKIAQSYSQYVKKLNVPFVFEGIEVPACPVEAKKFFYDDGFRWN